HIISSLIARTIVSISSVLSPPRHFLFLFMPLPPPRSTLFPYTTLFRSLHVRRGLHRAIHPVGPRPVVCRPRLEDVGHEGLGIPVDRKSTRLNSSHGSISYAVFCLKKKKNKNKRDKPTHKQRHECRKRQN